MSALLLLIALVAGESYRTEVIFLGELSADRAIALHERVIGDAGESTIVRGRQANMIVVKDTPERLSRFRKLLAALDAAGSAELHVYVRPVRHVLPSALAARAAEVYDGANGGGGAPKMVPDDRSMQLVVMCPPDQYRALDRLLRKLDVAAGLPSARPGQGRAVRVTPAPDGPFPP